MVPWPSHGSCRPHGPSVYLGRRRSRELGRVDPSQVVQRVDQRRSVVVVVTVVVVVSSVVGVVQVLVVVEVEVESGASCQSPGSGLRVRCDT